MEKEQTVTVMEATGQSGERARNRGGRRGDVGGWALAEGEERGRGGCSGGMWGLVATTDRTQSSWRGHRSLQNPAPHHAPCPFTLVSGTRESETDRSLPSRPSSQQRRPERSFKAWTLSPH